MPIVFILAHTDQKWQLRSWDGFEIPKPFARITVAYTPPIAMDDADVRTAAARTDEFKARMESAMAELVETHRDPRRWSAR